MQNSSEKDAAQIPNSEATNAKSEEVTTSQEIQKPYSIYTKKEKWFLVFLIAFSGLFSPLTSSIYFPAIPAMADAFHESVELINLTITVYMIFQGVSPMLFGTLADNLGRRLIYASCLLILSLTCVGLALVPTSDYWLLVLLRCIQPAGSASTIALGAGVIGDIAEPHERGGFFGVYQSGPLLAPAIGPVIGGLLADHLGWRAIFWFICIASGVAFAVIIVFLPETLRSIVGDGSIRPSYIHRPLIQTVGQRASVSQSASPSESRRHRKPFLNPFKLLKNWDISLILFFNGIVCAVYYAVTATISTLFADAYPFLNETDIGLCFLSIGGGMFAGSLSSGKILDYEFRSIEKRMNAAKANTESKGDAPKTGRYDANFPIEQARLRLIPYIMVIYVGCVIGYGWCIEKRVQIAGPLILQFIVGFTSILMMNASATFIVDLVPKQSSSVSACNNLFRGLLGAALVSVIDLIANAISTGWTFVLLGCVCTVLTPLVYLVISIGPKCRALRRKLETQG